MNSRRILSRLFGAIVITLLIVSSTHAVIVGRVINTPGPSIVSDIAVEGRESLIGLRTQSTAEATLTSNARISVRVLWNGSAVGVDATEQSTVMFPKAPGTVGGGLTVVDVYERAIGNAVALRASLQATVNFRGRAFIDSETNGDAIFAQASDNANMVLDGAVQATQSGNGHIIIAQSSGDSNLILAGFAEATESGNGNIYGLLVSGNSQSTWMGVLNLTEHGNGAAILASVSGSVRAELSGVANVESNGNGVTFGVITHGQSHVTFDADVVLRSSEYRDAVLLDLAEASQVVFNGRLVAPTNGNFNPGNRDVPPISMSGNAELKLIGGELLFAAARGRGSVELSDLELSDHANLIWSGGLFKVASLGVDVAPTFLLENASTLTIIGRSFNYPLGEVLDLTGHISGVLSDGNPFTMNFERAFTSKILLVPEPHTILLLLLVGTCLVWTRTKH